MIVTAQEEVDGALQHVFGGAAKRQITAVLQ
jgi:hypothetical protein